MGFNINIFSGVVLAILGILAHVAFLGQQSVANETRGQGAVRVCLYGQKIRGRVLDSWFLAA